MNIGRVAATGPAAQATAPAAVQAAFDYLAGSYDEAFSESIIGRLQRAAVWRQIDSLFQPGDQVLDLGCGTGVDAVHLAIRGVQVHAIDISPEMIQATRRRLRQQGLGDRVTSEVLRIEDLEHWRTGQEPPTSNQASEFESPASAEHRQADRLAQVPERLEARLDGALSNFGALNCVSDLRRLAKILGTVVRPGGRVAICVMNRFCLWELCYYTLTGQFRKATRRLRHGGAHASLGSPKSFPVQYPTRRQLADALNPDLRLVAISGIGVFVPPSYLGAFATRFPGWMRALDQVDRIVGRWPGFRSVGDHCLLIFEKRLRSPRQVGTQRAVPTVAQARSLTKRRTNPDTLPAKAGDSSGS